MNLVMPSSGPESSRTWWYYSKRFYVAIIPVFRHSMMAMNKINYWFDDDEVAGAAVAGSGIIQMTRAKKKIEIKRPNWANFQFSTHVFFWWNNRYHPLTCPLTVLCGGGVWGGSVQRWQHTQILFMRFGSKWQIHIDITIPRFIFPKTKSCAHK